MINPNPCPPGCEPLNVCLSVPSLEPRTGGPARTVPALAFHVQSDRIRPCLFGPGEPSSHYVGLAHEPCRDDSFFLQGKAFARFLSSSRIALVHDNGIWHPFNHMVSLACDKLNIPRIVSPHGMLEPWPLRYKKWKKRIAWRLYQHGDLKTAAVLHAMTPIEMENIRKLGFKQPIAVIPNGVDFPEKMPLKQHCPDGMRKALFLSRLHPKKGLKDLIRAWNRVRPRDWELHIAGPDEGGHEHEVKTMVQEFRLTSTIHFLGPLSDQEKWRTYRSSDLFILPTYSENFGLVVAEALAAELPVITTTETPWKIIEEEECGWWIQPGEASLVSTLNQVLRLSGQELHAMGQRGRAMVLRQYDWNLVARSMSDVYRWIICKGPRPECIFE